MVLMLCDSTTIPTSWMGNSINTITICRANYIDIFMDKVAGGITWLN